MGISPSRSPGETGLQDVPPEYEGYSLGRLRSSTIRVDDPHSESKGEVEEGCDQAVGYGG